MLTTIAGTNQPARVIAAGDGPGVLVNRDLTNVAFTSDVAGFSPSDVTASIHDPLVGIPYDGTEDVYACVSPGVSIQMDYIINAQNWQPSPAQAAAQISALGLATAVNQGTQITAANATNTVLNTGIAIPIGASTDATSQVISNAAQGINANHAALDSMGVNPYFTNPNGNADVSGWTTNGAASVVTAGKNGSIALPAGSGFANGAKLTPNATANHAVLLPGGNGQPAFAVAPFQTVISHFVTLIASIANSPQALCEYSWYTSTGVFISNTLVETSLLMANTWFKVYGSAEAPSNAAFCQVSYGIAEAINVPATDVFFVCAAISHAVGSPGSRAGDHAQHIAATGVPLLVNRNYLFNQNGITVPGTGGQVSPAAGTVGFNQIGYEGTITLSAPGATTNVVTCQIIVTWFDGAIAVDSQVYNVYAGQSTSTPHSIYIKGPTRGTSVSISFGNNNSGIAITASIQMFQVSHVYEYDMWRTIVGLFMSGTGASVANAAFGTSFNIIATNTAAGLAAGATQSYVLPLYTGRVFVGGSSNSGAADLQIFFSDTIGPFPGNTMFNQFTNAAGVLAFADYGLIHNQLTVGLRNTNAAAKNVGVEIIGMDY